MKFIELTQFWEFRDPEKIMINFQHVSYFEPHPQGTLLCFAGEGPSFVVKESYDHICREVERLSTPSRLRRKVMKDLHSWIAGYMGSENYELALRSATAKPLRDFIKLIG